MSNFGVSCLTVISLCQECNLSKRSYKKLRTILSEHQVTIPSYNSLHEELKANRPRLERWTANPHDDNIPEGVLANLQAETAYQNYPAVGSPMRKAVPCFWNPFVDISLTVGNAHKVVSKAGGSFSHGSAYCRLTLVCHLCSQAALKLTFTDAVMVYEENGNTLPAENGQLDLNVKLKWGLGKDSIDTKSVTDAQLSSC